MNAVQNSAITSASVIAILILIGALAGRGLVTGFFRVIGQTAATAALAHRQGIGRRGKRKYIKRVLTEDVRHPLGFLAIGVSVDEMYVPLQYLDSNNRLADVRRKIETEPLTVVLGSAGAGKSMFLRHQLVRWAKSPHTSSRIPTLVQLYEYEGVDKNLRSLILGRLKRRGLKIRTPEAFLEKVLGAGALTLFLDGFDEVVSTRRGNLASEILELADRYEKLQIVVTSRDSVYEGELRPKFSHEVRISDFTEANMRAFLRMWFRNPPVAAAGEACPPLRLTNDIRDTVDKMMADLRANPTLHQLARRPLLLAMIASLEAIDPGVGPTVSRSRAEFYKLLVQHLLRRDKDLARLGDVSVYRASHKQAALSLIALMAQANSGSNKDDRGISETDALACIASVLQRLNMTPSEHSNKLLAEIVQRSELLRWVGDGALIFPHLTIQEFLASVQLRDDPVRLISLYRTDPKRWQESLKLWCGADHDATLIIEELLAEGSSGELLALECLSEARQLDETVAGRVVDNFLNGVSNGQKSGPAVERALGALAVEPGSRGSQVLASLKVLSASSIHTQGRSTAIGALASSRLPEAAAHLASLPDSNSEDVRVALRAIGEAAIPALLDRARAGSTEAIDDLASIATPSAAIALTQLLSDVPTISTHAAWLIATLTGLADIEEHLNDSDFSFEQSPESINWVGKPFAVAGRKSFPSLVSRLAFLIRNTTESEIPQDLGEVDLRLALPLLSQMSLDDLAYDSPPPADIVAELGNLRRSYRHLPRLGRTWRDFALVVQTTRDVKDLVILREKFAAHLPVVPAAILRSLDLKTACNVIQIMIYRRDSLTKESWLRAFRPARNPQIARRFAYSVNALAVTAIVATGMVRAGLATFNSAYSLGPWWLNPTSFAIIVLPLLIVIPTLGTSDRASKSASAVGEIVPAEDAVITGPATRTSKKAETVGLTAIIAEALGILVAGTFYTVLAISTLIDWFELRTIFLTVIGIAALLATANLLHKYQARDFQNPFRRALAREPSETDLDLAQDIAMAREYRTQTRERTVRTRRS